MHVCFSFFYLELYSNCRNLELYSNCKLLKEKWSENLKFNLVWERNSFLRQHSSKVYLSLSLSCILTAYTSASPYLDIQESSCYRYTKSLRHELLVKSQTIQTKVIILWRSLWDSNPSRWLSPRNTKWDDDTWFITML